jgi:hypothetical protein
VLPETVVKVAVVEIQTGGSKPRILKDVLACLTLFESELARLALDEIGGSQPYRQVTGTAPWTGVPAGLQESFDSRGQLALIIRPAGFEGIAHSSFSK